MEDEEEGLGHALVVHDAQDGVGVDPAEHVVDGELVVDHGGHAPSNPRDCPAWPPVRRVSAWFPSLSRVWRDT